MTQVSIISLPQKSHFSSASKSLSLLLTLSWQHVACFAFYHGTRIFRCDLPSKRRLALLRKLSLVGLFFFPSRSKSVSWRADAHQVASPIRQWSSFSMNPSCCFCDLVSVHHSPSGTASAPESWGAPTAPGEVAVEPGDPHQSWAHAAICVLRPPAAPNTEAARDPQPCACNPAASLSLFLQSAEPRACPRTLLLTLHRALEKQSQESAPGISSPISILTARFFTYFFSPPSLPSEPSDLSGEGRPEVKHQCSSPTFPHISNDPLLKGSNFWILLLWEAVTLSIKILYCIFSFTLSVSPSVWTCSQ